MLTLLRDIFKYFFWTGLFFYIYIYLVSEIQISWIHQSRSTSKDLHMSALSKHWMLSKGPVRSDGWSRQNQRTQCYQYSLMMMIKEALFSYTLGNLLGDHCNSDPGLYWYFYLGSLTFHNYINYIEYFDDWKKVFPHEHRYYKIIVLWQDSTKSLFSCELN